MSRKRQLTRLVGSANYRLLRPGASVPADPAPVPIRLRSPQDLLGLLEEQINAVRAAPWTRPLAKARLLAQLSGAALKAFEVGQLAARLEMLAVVLKQRQREERRP